MSHRLIALALTVLAACTSGVGEPTNDIPAARAAWSKVANEEVPWTLVAPNDWPATIERSRPSPDLRVGLLRMWIGTSNFQRGWSLGPNAGAGASARLGRAAVMLKVQVLWSPAHRAIRWSPDPRKELRLERDWGTHADHQNPGWIFNERHLCQGRECISATLWYGPDASEESISDAQRVRESIALVIDWTDG
jgi:hypothetical protein